MSTLYIPRFFSTPVEKHIKQKLTHTFCEKKYQRLLELNMHAVKMATSFDQLYSITGSQKLSNLHNEIAKILQEIVDKDVGVPKFVTIGGTFTYDYQLLQRDIENLKNNLNQIKSELDKAQTANMFFCAINLLTNSLVCIFSSIALAAILLTAPGAPLLLIPAIILLSTIGLSSYSIYVDIEFLRGRQLDTIENGLNFLHNDITPDLVQNPNAIQPAYGI